MKFVEMIGYGIFLSLSLILSFLISLFEISNALRFDVLRGLYLSVSLLIIFIFIFFSLNKKFELLKLFMKEKYAIINFLIFLITIIFSLLIINLVYNIYTFDYNLPSEDYRDVTKLLRISLDNYGIASASILIFISLVYSYLFNSGVKKLKPLKASVFSVIYTVLAILAFLVVSVIVRIVYYMILLVAVGISVG